MNFLLQYGPLAVGSVVDAFESDDTWFGVFQPAPADSPLNSRIQAFVAFSKEWHSRLEAGLDPCASEFDSFRDVLKSGLWHAIASDGSVHGISEAPVFVGTEISWRPA